jgi:2-polyprenyl-6-methoxyphenol hydroxylase-like FAD-dependent oxidoreductase
MKAIIIGGGIGGLAAALALQRAGIEPHVFERAAAPREVGAGLSLWSNAVRVLDALGLSSAMRRRGWSELETEIRTWRGRLLVGGVSEARHSRGGTIVGAMHRADLLDVLREGIDGAHVHFDHECTGVSSDGSAVTARFGNGRAEQGDVLIGADGLHSVVRQQAFGAAPPRYAGYTAWRGVVSFATRPSTATESWGRGRRFGIVPLNDGRVYWFATTNAPEHARHPASDVKPALLQLFRGWHAPIEALIDATGESAILRNDIYDRDPLRSWRRDRVTLLGDAAHPMTPNLGQGACQALEDAVVLAASLARHDRIDTALARYEARRIPRTTRIVLLSRRIGQMAQWESALACLARNAVVRAMPRRVNDRQMASVIRDEAPTEDELSAVGHPRS